MQREQFPQVGSQIEVLSLSSKIIADVVPGKCANKWNVNRSRNLKETLAHRTYENVPQRFTELPIASAVKTGIAAPEKNASCSCLPTTVLAIHCVSSDPHSVFLFRNFLLAGILVLNRFPLPPTTPSLAKTAAISAGCSSRICATAKLEKLIEIFSPPKPTSPVTPRAVVLIARQDPRSWAANARKDPNSATVTNPPNCFIPSACHSHSRQATELRASSDSIYGLAGSEPPSACSQSSTVHPRSHSLPKLTASNTKAKARPPALPHMESVSHRVVC